MTFADTALSKERLRLWLKLLKTSNRISGAVRKRLRDDHASTLPRFDVMSALARFPDGLKMSALSDLLRVSNGNVTGIVDRLVEDGLVRRIAQPGDRRAQIARLTAEGRTAFDRLAAEHECWIDDLLGGLGRDDIAAVTARLDRVLDHLDQGDASV